MKSQATINKQSPATSAKKWPKWLLPVYRFKQAYPNIYEFIMFNLLSNIATITNFVVLWLGTLLFFRNMTQPFNWWIFHYGKSQGGLGGFLAFLLAYVCAQIVNYFVQRYWVFDATVQISKTIGWYILTVTVAGIVSIWLPPYVIAFLNPYIHGWAPTVANIVNIIMQVIINYPMLKFVIMKK